MHSGICAYAQKITMVLQNEPLENAFKELRKQSKYDFLYNEALIADRDPVSISIKNGSIKVVLDSLLSGSPQLTYSIKDKLVMISRKEVSVSVQETYQISGVVKDKEGKPVPGARILLSNYKIGTIADNQGRFIIVGLKPGNYNVLVEMMGYQPVNNNVLITNGPADIEVFLSEQVKQLNEVVIMADPNRKRYLNIFKKSFIGTTPNAKQCDILNPEVLYTVYDKDNQILKVAADELLLIENKALGYRIKYLLRYYERDEQTGVVVFYGYPYFEEMEARPGKRRKYVKSRQKAYVGSPQHFFRSLYQNKCKEEGFIINDLVKAPNVFKHSAAVINKHINFGANVRIKGNVWSRKDSLNYLSLMKKESDTLEVLVRKDITADELVKPSAGSLKLIEPKEALYITFTGEKEDKTYLSSGYRIERPRDLAPFQVSLLYPLRGPIGFYENGALYDPGSVLFEGIWGFEKVADMVPMDYIMQK